MLTLFSAIRNRRRRGTEYENKVANMNPTVRAQLTDDILQASVFGGGGGVSSANDDNEENDDNTNGQDHHDSELQDMEASLEKAVIMLQTAMEREEFVGMRLRRYQAILREQARELELPPESNNDGRKTTSSGNSATVDQSDDQVNANGAVVGAVDESDHHDDADDTTIEAATDEEAGAPNLSPEERERRMAKVRQDVAALQKVEQDYETLKEHTRSLKKRVFKLERQRDEILKKIAECQEFLFAAAVVEGREEVGMEESEVDDPVPVVAHQSNRAGAEAKMIEMMAVTNLEGGNNKEYDSDDDSCDSDDDDLYDHEYTAQLMTTKNDGSAGDAVIEKSAE